MKYITPKMKLPRTHVHGFLRREIKTQKLTKANILKLPQSPGVYIFFSNEKAPLYIGKANNLKSRVNSYRQIKLTKKTKQMICSTKYFAIYKVNSDLEALLLEAHLVKKYKPHFNILLKDDKNPLYIQITKEKYPRVLTARKNENNTKNLLFLGPFPSSGNVRMVLRLLRIIFPFSDHKLGKRGCLRSQIGLCNPCPNLIENSRNGELRKLRKKQYLRNVNLIKGILEGKIKSVRNKLDRQMKEFSKNEKFEKAIQIRTKIEKLDYITQPITPIKNFLKNPNLLQDLRNEEIKKLRKILSEYLILPKKFKRIECYDISHMAGVNPTASMITFINGESEKSFYRRFKIRQGAGSDDLASLKEVANRREKHLSTWGTPDLIIVDGGKGQARVFYDVFNKHKIPVVGLAKRFESLVVPIDSGGQLKFKQFKVPAGPCLFLLQRLRDEAHRFARSYHHKLLQKSLLNN